MNGNKPAFPAETAWPDSDCPMGLTKREWLAGLAMQGLMTIVMDTDAQIPELAHDAVHAADALLAELAKGGA